MSRAGSLALQAHYAQGTTTVARCWWCRRVDGQVFGFTSLDRNITFEGVEYEAATGFTPSAIEGKLDMSVPNLEVAGFLESASITENDLLGGKWDGCQVEIFEVNYLDLTMGRVILVAGTIGNVTAGVVSFNAELRGLMQRLQQPVGEHYTKTCTAIFGDARCKYPVEALRVPGAVTTVINRASFGTAMTEPDDYFGGGVVRWIDGLNEGLDMEVASFVAGAFILNAAMPFNIAPGDAFTVIPGCRKRLDDDCRDKWANVINFRGFRYVPGNDKILGNGARPQ